MRPLLLCLLTFIAFSQENTTSTSISDEKVLDWSNFSFKAVASYDMNLRKEKDIDSDKNMVFDFLTTYRWNTQYATTLFLRTNKALVGGRELGEADSKLINGLGSYELAKDLKYSPSITGVIPTSEDSRKKDWLKTAIELNSSLSYQLTPFLSFSYNPRLRKNIHRYKFNRTNKELTSYQVLQFFSMTYSFNDKLSMTPLLIYVNSWGYKNGRKDPAYLSDVSVSYSFNKSIASSVGISTRGKIIDNERSEDEAISFFDKEKTSLYLSAEYRF